jgi:hypothetical protein
MAEKGVVWVRFGVGACIADGLVWHAAQGGDGVSLAETPGFRGWPFNPHCSLAEFLSSVRTFALKSWEERFASLSVQATSELSSLSARANALQSDLEFASAHGGDEDEEDTLASKRTELDQVHSQMSAWGGRVASLRRAAVPWKRLKDLHSMWMGGMESGTSIAPFLPSDAAGVLGVGSALGEAASELASLTQQLEFLWAGVALAKGSVSLPAAEEDTDGPTLAEPPSMALPDGSVPSGVVSDAVRAVGVARAALASSDTASLTEALSRARDAVTAAATSLTKPASEILEEGSTYTLVLPLGASLTALQGGAPAASLWVPKPPAARGRTPGVGATRATSPASRASRRPGAVYGSGENVVRLDPAGMEFPAGDVDDKRVVVLCVALPTIE